MELYFPTAAEVEVIMPSTTINEGSQDTVCVILLATSGSPMSLANPLAVYLSTVLSGEAGLVEGNKLSVDLMLFSFFHSI